MDGNAGFSQSEQVYYQICTILKYTFACAELYCIPRIITPSCFTQLRKHGIFIGNLFYGERVSRKIKIVIWRFVTVFIIPATLISGKDRKPGIEIVVPAVATAVTSYWLDWATWRAVLTTGKWKKMRHYLFYLQSNFGLNFIQFNTILSLKVKAFLIQAYPLSPRRFDSLSWNKEHILSSLLYYGFSTKYTFFNCFRNSQTWLTITRIYPVCLVAYFHGSD